MGKKVPKENVDPVLVDVKKPDLNYEHASEFETINLDHFSESKAFESSGPDWFSILLRFSGGLAVLLVAAFSVLFVTNIKDASRVIQNKRNNFSENFSQSFRAVKNFKPKKARKELNSNQKNLKKIQNSLGYSSSSFVFELASGAVPLIKKAGGFLTEATSLNVEMMKVANILSYFKREGFQDFMSNGGQFLSKMKKLDELVNDMKHSVKTLKSNASYLDNFSGLTNLGGLSERVDKYHSKYIGDLNALDDFMNGMIELLSSDKKKRILLMFQNSSEMRPAGGFLGSYGELIIKDGQMVDIKVEDIYWPDHPKNFDLKLIPPKPLQRITKKLGARDANWFFNFPTSAETVMRLLESSRIYKEDNIKFEGAIAINVEVLETVLEYVGPITVKNYNMRLTDDNFLAKLQREVEVGRDKKQGRNPKRILSVVAPKILNQLKKLKSKKLSGLMGDLKSHITHKDIMFHSRDSRIAEVLDDWHLNGSVYQPPSSFWGGYLSVVNANIGGAKSDAYTKQSVDVWVDVGFGGGSLMDVSVTKDNNGHKREAPWYNTTNRNYLRILSNLGSSLIFVKGNDKRKKITRTYSSEYRRYGKFKSLAESRVYLPSFQTWKTKEASKTGFGTWLLTPPGQKRTVDFRIETPSSDNFSISKDDKYTFVYESQSGMDTNLEVSIAAPVGYVWERTGSPMFTFERSNPKKRVVIELNPENVQ